MDGGRSYRAESSNSYADAQSRVRHTDSYNEAGAAFLGTDGVVSPVGSYIRSILSGIFSFGMGIPFVAAVALSFGDFGMLVLALFLGALTAGGCWSLFKGIKKIGLIRRARKLLKMMEERDTITIKEVAAAFGKTEKELASEVNRLLTSFVIAGVVEPGDASGTKKKKTKVSKVPTETVPEGSAEAAESAGGHQRLGMG